VGSLEFYAGLARDHRGRRLTEILAWPDDELENQHDFIQWLFPLREGSMVNPNAPVLDNEVVAAFHASGELRKSLRRSFLRMLAFYGFDWKEGEVVPAPDFEQISQNWFHPGNHNHLRITRILKSLTALGLSADARAFYRALEKLYGGHPERISATSFRFWSAAVSTS